MKLTYWEISIINQAIGIQGTTNIANLEIALSLRKKVNKDEYNNVCDFFFKAQTAKELQKKDQYVDIFKKEDDIKFNLKEVQFAYNALSNPKVQVPILDESLALFNKLKKAIDESEKQKQKSEEI